MDFLSAFKSLVALMSTPEQAIIVMATHGLLAGFVWWFRGFLSSAKIEALEARLDLAKDKNEAIETKLRDLQASLAAMPGVTSSVRFSLSDLADANRSLNATLTGNVGGIVR